MSGKSSFILTASEIIYTITDIVGLRPYKLPLGTSGKASLTIFHLVQLIIFLCIYIPFTLLVSTIPILDTSNDNDIFNITFQHTVLGSMIFIVTYTVLFAINFKKWWSFHSEILKQELELQEFGLKLNSKKNILFAKLFIFSCIVICSLLEIWFWCLLNKSPVIKSVLIIGNFHFIITLTSIIVMVIMYLMDIYLKFSALNDCLRYVYKLILVFLTTDSFSSENLIGKTSISIQKQVYDFAIHYDKLNAYLQNVMKYCSFQIILCWSLITVQTAVSLQWFCISLSSSNIDKLSIFFLFLEFYFYFLMFLGNITGSLVSYTAKATAILLHKTILRIKDEQVIEKLEYFSLQILHTSPKVSCGLFNLNLELQFSIFGIIIAYFIILIQFQAFIHTTISGTAANSV